MFIFLGKMTVIPFLRITLNSKANLIYYGFWFNSSWQRIWKRRDQGLPWLRLCAPHGRGPGSSPVQGIRFHKCQSLSCVWLFASPRTVAHQVPLPMQFSRQEYWSGLPFPFPGDLPDPGIEPGFPLLQAESLPSELQGSPNATTKRSCMPQWRPSAAK